MVLGFLSCYWVD